MTNTSCLSQSPLSNLFQYYSYLVLSQINATHHFLGQHNKFGSPFYSKLYTSSSLHLCIKFPELQLTLRTSQAGFPALRKLSCGVSHRYTGGTVCQCQVSHADIPALFSKAYWHQNARVIVIQTTQQLKNNLFHETQEIFVNKFCIWTPSSHRTS